VLQYARHSHSSGARVCTAGLGKVVVLVEDLTHYII
jgi:hypothetical protein